MDAKALKSMNIITFNDYNSISAQEQILYLQDIIGNKELRLIGEIDRIKDNCCIIKSPRRIHDHTPIENTFKYEGYIDSILGLNCISNELKEKNINEGVIFFSVEVQKFLSESRPDTMLLKEGSIVKALDVEEYYRKLKISKPKRKNVFKDFSLDRENNVLYMSEDIKQCVKGLTDELVENQSKLTDLKLEKKNIEKEISSINELYEKEKHVMYEKIHDEENAERTKLEKDIEELKRVKSNLDKYKLLYRKDNQAKIEEKMNIKEKIRPNINEFLSQIQGYLLMDNKKSLYYDIETLCQFYVALRTDQLIILAGSPGTGKTSLVEGYARAIDAEFRMISVQSNWMDRIDLMGFYNPIEKNYISTPFLDAILEAKENPKKIYFICLDEMNLAHVEYYFAEFLSKLQTNRIINLYSKNIKEEINFELQERYNIFIDLVSDKNIEDFLKGEKQVDINNYFMIKRQLSMLRKYEPEIEIPENIRFIGTINKDETTKDLSPKVVDRSFLITINMVEEDKMNKLRRKLELEGKTKFEQIHEAVEDISIKAVVKNINEIAVIKQIKETLKKYHIHLNYRIDKVIDQMVGTKILSRENPVYLKNLILANLVLPKINADSYDIDIENLAKEMYLFTDMEFSKKTLDGMKVFDKDNKLTTLTYWR